MRQRSHERLNRLLRRLLLLALCLPCVATAESLQLALEDGNEIAVEVMPAEGDLLMIWVVDHDQQRPQFEGMLAAINAQDIEIWRVDPLADYFLPRSSENVRTLAGSGIAAVIAAAHEHSTKTIMLAAYDRMPLPVLRAVRIWSQRQVGARRLAGSILYYPNLFGPPPVAGRPPELDPVVAASNYPLVIVQPALGSQRWRLQRVMQTLWRAGAPAYAQILPDIRDWFFMHQPGENPREDQATRAVPAQIKLFLRLLDAAEKPTSVLPLTRPAPANARVRELVPFDGGTTAATLDLPDLRGERSFEGFHGKVTLVSFWATWCPPCVEEVPSLNRLQAHYHGKPFALVSVDFRESPEQIEKFRKEIAVEFPVLLDRDGRVALEWGVFSFPSSFLVDSRGKIRYSINRAIDWDTPQVHAVIDSLLAEAGQPAFD